MRKFLYLLFFLPVFSFGQDVYQWKNIEKITFYDLSKQGFDCKIQTADQIPKGVKSVLCNTATWTETLSELSTYKYDLRAESCYLLLIKFKTGTIIPFQFFPEQKVLVDLRKDKWQNILYFDQKVQKKLEDLFESCVECLKDPKCKEANEK